MKNLVLVSAVLWLGLAVASAATLNVAGSGTSFNPKVLSVNSGDTVVWTLTGSHTVSPRAGSTEAFCGSGGVTTCTVTFNAAGTFPYQCNFHAGFNMTGMVTVAAAAPVVTVSITNPINNRLFATPGIIPVGVHAISSTGVIVRIDLFTNGVPAATNGLGAFTFALSNLSAGNYSLQARAMDNLPPNGSISTSAPINIRVATRPILTAIRTNVPLSFSFDTQAGVNYLVDGSTNLTNFAAVITNVGTGAKQVFTQTNPAPAHRFFRLRLE